VDIVLFIFFFLSQNCFLSTVFADYADHALKISHFLISGIDKDAKRLVYVFCGLVLLVWEKEY
jgi:hypothetical protein